MSLRIFNAYGPGQDLPPSDPPVIPHLLRQVQTGGSQVIFGDGTQTRDFVYVDDVMDALVAAATATEVNRAVVNIGSGQEVQIGDLAARIARIAGKQADVLHSPGQSVGVSRLVAERSDDSVAIPIRGHADSLNVSVACGILLYEVRRQQGWL